MQLIDDIRAYDSHRISSIARCHCTSHSRARHDQSLQESPLDITYTRLGIKRTDFACLDIQAIQVVCNNKPVNRVLADDMVPAPVLVMWHAGSP